MTATKCECAQYFVAGEPNQPALAETHCEAATTNTFAPGHDAKLKSLLIKAGVVGRHVTRGGVTRPAVDWSYQFGFGPQVEAGIAKGRNKIAERAAKRMARSAKAKAREVAPSASRAQAENEAFNQALREVQAERNTAIEAAPTGLVKAKVGRWVKEGNVTPNGFTYYDAKHVAQTTTKYTLV